MLRKPSTQYPVPKTQHLLFHIKNKSANKAGLTPIMNDPNNELLADFGSVP